ncbi:MAG: DUF4397 domain-containing protein [Planctomycetota bacterium]|nr:DUF4397 domain-containing protein [Planctomycetota bacterium]
MKLNLALALIAVAGVASSASAVSQVRVFHGSPDAPAVDILVNDAPAFTSLAFRSVTSYASLPAATYNVKVNAAGTSTTVINADLALADNTTYTVAAVNTLANIEPLVLVDDNTLDAGKARIRFVHASPNAPAVDIAVVNGPVLFSNISFRGVGSYLAVDANTYDLEVRVAGTTTSVLTIPGVALQNNTVYTAWAVGLVGGSPALGAVVTVDAIPAPGAVAALGLAGLLGARRRRAALA